MTKRIAIWTTVAIVLLTFCIWHIVDMNKDDEGCKTFFTLKSLEEYQEYITQNKDSIPNDFVYWEDVAFIEDSEFSCLTFQTNDQYAYHFNNARTNLDFYGTTIGISHTSKSTIWSGTIVVDSVSGNGNGIAQVFDMPMPFIYRRGDCSYHYYASGALAEIYFAVNGIEYRIECDFDKYLAIYSETLISRLLSADETVANAAFAELMENLSK